MYLSKTSSQQNVLRAKFLQTYTGEVFVTSENVSFVLKAIIHKLGKHLYKQ